MSNKKANSSTFKFKSKKGDLIFSFVKGKKQVKVIKGSKVYTFHISIMEKGIKFIRKTIKESRKIELLLTQLSRSRIKKNKG